MSADRQRRSFLSVPSHLLFTTQPDELLQQRLFAVTRRSLHADLQILTEQGWLKRQGRQYYRVHDFPNRPAVRGIRYDKPTEPVA